VTRAWSEWRPFPDPRQGGMLTAPFGAGCYVYCASTDFHCPPSSTSIAVMG
jgi:hypothetical protein